MADRKQFRQVGDVDPELSALLEATRHVQVTNEELLEQRISFAYGNADSDLITKESVRTASQSMRLVS